MKTIKRDFNNRKQLNLIIMERYHYQPVNTDKKNDNRWIIFFRQLFICSGAWTMVFISGLAVGAITIVIAQFGKVEPVSEEMSSWITCSGNIYGPFWTLVFTILAKRKGRKIGFGISCLLTLLGFIIFYFSTSLSHFLISEVFKSAAYASNFAMGMFIMTECTTPKYRGLFLAIGSATFTWGMWVANAIGTFFHWKYICVAAFICFIYVGTFVFWPDSPLWLATKGRFQECAETHRWLKGTGEEAEKELKMLLETAKEFKKSPEKVPVLTQIKEFFNLLKKNTFYKPLWIVLIVTSQPIASGKMICAMYAIEFLTKVTNDTSKAYSLMLILDGVTILGMYCGCIMVRFINRRTLLIRCSILCVVFLLIFSLYLYLVDMNIIVQNNVACILILTAFSLSIACGPMVMCFSIFGELIPIDSRTTFTIVSGSLCVLTGGIYMKIAPYIFNRLSLYLTFLTYAISASLVTFGMYKYLPETKDKTLEEIKEFFNEEEKKDTRRQ